MTDTLDIAHNIDEAACLDILSDMVRHKSYSETPGERASADGAAPVVARASCSTVTLTPIRFPRDGSVDPWGGCNEGTVLLLSRAPDLRDLSGGPVGAAWFYRPPTKSCRG